MIRTHPGEDPERVRGPFTADPVDSFELISRNAAGRLADFDPAELRPQDAGFLVRRSFGTCYRAGGLFGTVEQAAAGVARASAAVLVARMWRDRCPA